jgi:hypothetical protein
MQGGIPHPPITTVLLTRKRHVLSLFKQNFIDKLPQGTPYFMPHEILDLKSLYVPEVGKRIKVDEETDKRAFFVNPLKSKPKAPQVIYNFQHDLESVWWILMWTLTARVLHQPSTDFAKTIFKNQTSLWHEREVCIVGELTGRLSACLEKSLHSFIAPLEGARMILLIEYAARAQDGKLFDLGSYRTIHILFVSFFQVVQSAEPSDWRDMRLYTNEPQPSTLAVRSSSQLGGTSQLAADAPNVPQPGRNKRARMPGNAEYEPSESEESETQSEWVDSEDEKKEKWKKRKGTMRRKKPRTADVETGP